MLGGMASQTSRRARRFLRGVLGEQPGEELLEVLVLVRWVGDGARGTAVRSFVSPPGGAFRGGSVPFHGRGTCGA